MAKLNVKKSPLVGLLEGEQPPAFPEFNPGWTLERYNNEMQAYLRKLHDYIRRLMGRLNGINILQELTTTAETNFNTFITNILDGKYSTTTISNTFTVTCNGDGTFTVTPSGGTTTVLIPSA